MVTEAKLDEDGSLSEVQPAPPSASKEPSRTASTALNLTDQRNWRQGCRQNPQAGCLRYA